MTFEDCDAIAALSGQLGYPASVSEVERRWRSLQLARGSAVFVAEASDREAADDGGVLTRNGVGLDESGPGGSFPTVPGVDHHRVVGWVHVASQNSLVSDPSVVIGGLVVDSSARGRGIGRALMEAAEGWAREHGFTSVRVRSNTVRTEAHEFYQRLGYHLEKTQCAFRKVLARESVT